MSRPTDQPEPPDSVPPAELNPLLNPLLAQHMGRWAETYFTSPPEKRDEAVQELLRQLREESSTRAVEEPLTSVGHPAGDPSQPVGSPIVSALPMIVCRSCGHENPVDQRFCGMCGTMIQQAHAETEISSPDEPRSLGVTEPETGNGFHHLHQVDRQQFPQYPADLDPEVRRAEPASIERVREIYTRNTESADYPLFESTQPSFAYSYRVFIGLALAVIIGVLLYMSWRSGQAASGLSPQAPQNPTASAPTQPSSDNPGAEKTESAKPASPKEEANNSASAPEPQTAKADSTASKAEAENTRPTSRPARTSPHESPSNTTQPVPVATGGGDELAMAKRYLSGSDGPRNPSQAADWLWKSVAKQNTEATVLLADLYLRGDGISKNCDQARVLLDAAARKGRADASERLRHMQAFGCH